MSNAVSLKGCYFFRIRGRNMEVATSVSVCGGNYATWFPSGK